MSLTVMKPMSAKAFLDSNIVVYSASGIEPVKQPVARGLLLQQCCLSPQVLFESLNVFLRKMKLPLPIAVRTIQDVMNYSRIVAEDESIVRKALQLYETGSFQPYDAKIVATALSAGCSIVYSEDMHHGRVVEGAMTIINPFL